MERRSDHGVGQPSGSRAAALSDRALLEAIRAQRPDAIEELIRRCHSLVLRQATRLGIPRDERVVWAMELLYHVAMSIARETASTPRAIGPYVATACKRKAFTERRDRVVRERWEGDSTEELGGHSERAVVAACSEDSLRAARGPAWEQPELPPVLERLVARIDGEISEQERQLLSWVGQHVPYSLIAEWLGVSRAAVTKRITRLRARLIRVACRFGGTLDPADTALLVRFLRRAGAVDERRLAGLTAPSPDMEEGA